MYIKQSELLMGTSMDFIKRFMDISQMISHEKGDILFREKDPALHFFVLLNGRVKLGVGENDRMVYDIRRNGDSDALRYTSLFDGAQLITLAVTPAEIEMAKEQVPEELKTAIAVAKKNITRFHEAQATAPIQVQTAEGVDWRIKEALLWSICCIKDEICSQKELKA